MNRTDGNGDDEPDRFANDGYSRRTVLKTTGVGAAAFGGALGTAAAGTAVEKCSSGATIDVAPTFTSINNMWGTTNATQCIFLNDDDSYGWRWQRGSTGDDDPNYPEVLCGTKPWGSCTGSSFFPKQRGDFTQLDLALSKTSTYDKTQGEWDLAEEWWLTDVKPECGTNQGDRITHEVMLVLEWSDAHDHGPPIESNAIEDEFGNTIDYWAQYDIGHSFHIFRIAANAVPSNVDLKAVMDYMSSNVASVSPDHWVSGVEVGNEYWDDTSGSITWDRLDVTVNGATETSGSGVTQSPYGRASGWPVPGVVEAEDFDEGGEGVAYHDTTTGNEGGAYRATHVDLDSSTEHGYDVGWIVDGEWLEYTVDVASAGPYDLSARVASDSGGGAFHVDVDGSQVASASFPATGGWETWTTVPLGSVDLTAGEHVVRVTADQDAWNFNWFEFANLLTNPGFEDGTTGWWSHASFSTVSNPVHTGSAAGRASDRTSSWMGVRQTVTDQLSNEGQGTYDVSGFVRLGSGTGDARATVAIEDDDGTSYFTNTSVAVDDASWTRVADSLDLSWNGLNSAELYFETDGSLADLYVDDASMTFEG